MTYLKLSPLPRNFGALKGRIASNISRTSLVTNVPLRGLGVILCDNKLFSFLSNKP